MYVVGILESDGSVKIAHAGLIKSAAQIQDLTRRGIREVRVDLARSKLPSEPTTDVAQVPADAPNRNYSLASQEACRLRIPQLFQEARVLQEKLLTQARLEQSIDVGPLAEVADEMVETMFSYPDAMICLARIRSKDAYLMEHSLNVAILLAHFGRHLGMEKEHIKEVTLGGLMHDVGKIMTPSAILHKPGNLSDREFAVIREHPVHSRRILESTAGITSIMVDVAANHHERLDGSGYPLGLRGDQLSRYARMAAIVDVYDALTAERVYKAGMAQTRAFRMLLEDKQQHFDRDLVQSFIKCMGVYPAGALVLLSNHRLAIVLKQNEEHPLYPQVRMIFNVTSDHYIAPCDIDLAKKTQDIKIERCVDPKEFKIELEPFV